jgi:hypothetical protein
MTPPGQSDSRPATVEIPTELADALAQAISFMVDREYGVEGTQGVVGPPTGYLLERCRELGIRTEWQR